MDFQVVGGAPLIIEGQTYELGDTVNIARAKVKWMIDDGHLAVVKAAPKPDPDEGSD